MVLAYHLGGVHWSEGRFPLLSPPTLRTPDVAITSRSQKSETSTSADSYGSFTSFSFTYFLLSFCK